MPAIGMGSTQFWMSHRKQEKNAMYECIEQYGPVLIDTAEMYGYGRCEKTVGTILDEVSRDSVYLVGKILPDHVTSGNFERSLENTLMNLGTEYLDLYLIHWRANADLFVLVEEMEKQRRKGTILNWGVSNFDIHDMKDLMKIPDSEHCMCNQILYNLYTRGPEFDLLPFMKEHDVIPMSYSSLGSRYTDNSRVTYNREVLQICKENNITPYALMLAFNIRHGIASLFSTSSVSHMHENMQCLSFDVEPYLETLDRVFPAPQHAVPLEKL